MSYPDKTRGLPMILRQLLQTRTNRRKSRWMRNAPCTPGFDAAGGVVNWTITASVVTQVRRAPRFKRYSSRRTLIDGWLRHISGTMWNGPWVCDSRGIRFSRSVSTAMMHFVLDLWTSRQNSVASRLHGSQQYK